MMSSENIIDVNEVDFEYAVLKYSQNTPVVVDFWADWCKPCKVLTPILEKLALEADGAFRLARVDVDENPNLALLYGVRSIPTVKAFSSGQVTAEFVGLIPEEKIRDFLARITPPSPLMLALEKADSFALSNQWSVAEGLYRRLLNQNPDLPPALLGLAKTLLAQNLGDEALSIVQHFPASRFYGQAQLLLPFAETLVSLKTSQLSDDLDLDAAFSNAIRLAGRGKIPAALDGLLDILRQDKNYRQGRARQIVISLLEILGEENPQTREYRSELASILF